MLHRHAGPAVAGSYASGAVSGAAVTAGALLVGNGLLSPVPPQWRGTVALLALILLALHATRVLCMELPQRRYQIPRETFTSRPTVAAFRFAFELGTGVRTYITAAAPYALAVVLLLCLPTALGQAALAALAAAMGFGLGRTCVVAVQSVRNTIAVEHPQRWLRAADLIAVSASLAIAVRFLMAL